MNFKKGVYNQKRLWSRSQISVSKGKTSRSHGHIMHTDKMWHRSVLVDHINFFLGL